MPCNGLETEMTVILRSIQREKVSSLTHSVSQSLNTLEDVLCSIVNLCWWKRGMEFTSLRLFVSWVLLQLRQWSTSFPRFRRLSFYSIASSLFHWFLSHDIMSCLLSLGMLYTKWIHECISICIQYMLFPWTPSACHETYTLDMYT